MNLVAMQDMVLLFGLALFTVLIARKLTLPSIIGFLVAGMLAGPHALAMVQSPHEVEQMAEIGIVLLLFTIGIEFSLKELMRIRQMVFFGGGLQVVITILVVAIVAVICGQTPEKSIFYGFLAALSSTAIIMKLMSDAGEIDTPHGKTILGVLIFQDLCVVPLMLMVPLLGAGGLNPQDFVLTLAKAVAVVITAHYGARHLVPWLLGHIVRARSRELFILCVLFIGFGTAWLTAAAGLSLALGAFIAGLAISESEYSQQVLGDIMPFRDAFMSIFFLSVGMLLDPAIIINKPLVIVAIIAATIIIKVVVASAALRIIGLPAKVSMISAMALAQIGEFSFVLAQGGLSHGLLTADSYQLFLAATVATMALTPLFLRVSPTLAGMVENYLPSALAMGSRDLAQKNRTESISGHVIICGYGLNGRNLSKVLKHLSIPHLIIDSNPFTTARERNDGELVIFGDASMPEVLTHAHIEGARIIVIAISDASASRRIASQARQIKPQIHIIARTRYVLEVEPLYRLGVNEVVPEEFETSVEILSRVLRTYMVPHDEIEQHIAEVRSNCYGMFRSMKKRHSHAVGISGYLAGAELATLRVRDGSQLDGKSLREGTIKNLSGATVLVIKRGEELTPNPDPVWQLLKDDVVLLLGTPEQLTAANRLFGRQ